MAEEKKVLKLTLKKPEATPTPTPTPTTTPTPAAAPTPTPSVSTTGGVIKLILQNAKIHIDQVIIKREEKK